MGRADSLEKTLRLGKTAGKERRGWRRMRWFDGITNSMDTNLSTLTKITEDRGTRHATVHRVAEESNRTPRLNSNSQLWSTLLQGFLPFRAHLPTSLKVLLELTSKLHWHESLCQDHLLENQPKTGSYQSSMWNVAQFIQQIECWTTNIP